jgi:hypothetical protein
MDIENVSLRIKMEILYGNSLLQTHSDKLNNKYLKLADILDSHQNMTP